MNRSFRAQRVQHVSLARPQGSDDAARRFYGEILGLEEKPVPDTLAGQGLIWYRIGDDELHLFPAEASPDDRGQHFCIQVDDLDALRRRLEEAGVDIDDTIPIPNRPRFFCRDPFGNRIECTALLGSYKEGVD